MNNQDKPVRYIWDFTGHRYLYKTNDFNADEKIEIPLHDERNGHVFVNILERVDAHDVFKGNAAFESFHVKLFYPDGRVVEGWFIDTIESMKITNIDQLFDGRFNQ
jgi:hypothetical protein